MIVKKPCIKCGTKIQINTVCPNCGTKDSGKVWD